MKTNVKFELARTCRECPVKDFYQQVLIIGLDKNKLSKTLRANLNFAESSVKSLAQMPFDADRSLFELRQLLIATLKHKPTIPMGEGRDRARQAIRDTYEGTSLPKGDSNQECLGCSGAIESVCSELAAAMQIQDHIEALQNIAKELKKLWESVRPKAMSVLQRKFDHQLTQWLNEETFSTGEQK